MFEFFALQIKVENFTHCGALCINEKNYKPTAAGMSINLIAAETKHRDRKVKQGTHNRGNSLGRSHQHLAMIIHYKPSRRFRQRRRMVTQRPRIRTRIRRPGTEIIHNFNFTEAHILGTTAATTLALFLLVGGGGRGGPLLHRPGLRLCGGAERDMESVGG